MREQQPVSSERRRISGLLKPSLLALSLTVGLNLIATAQDYPIPSATPVNCTTCAAPYTNKPTWPFSSPIKRFAGRFIDSQATRDFQAPVRTLRARRGMVVPQRGRVYMMAGAGTFAAYNLSTFFTSTLGSPMKNLTTYDSQRVPGEQYLQWDAYMDPEWRCSGWRTVMQDGQDRLGGFDADDRNYIFLAYGPFGMGVVEEAGASDGGCFQVIHQSFEGGITPDNIIVLRDSSRYYAITWGSGGAALFDATTPASLRFMSNNAPSGVHAAKARVSPNFDHAAWVNSAAISFYSADALGSNPFQVVQPINGDASFRGITSDGVGTFYTIESNSAGVSNIVVMRKNGARYDVSRFPLEGYFAGTTIRYGEGYLTMIGADADIARNLRLVRLSGSDPVREVSTNNYFRNYYTRPPSGYAKPQRSSDFPEEAFVYRHLGVNYLIYMGRGLGDVYVIEEGTVTDSTPPSVTITTPTTASTYSTTSNTITLAGTAADNVGVTAVTWSISGGATGSAIGTTSWTANISIPAGVNNISVTARDAAGNSASKLIAVTRSAGDSVLPTVAITSSPALLLTKSSRIVVSGTASDNVGVTSVTWLTNLGVSGTASGTSSWTFSPSVDFGTTQIVVTARDAAGNYATAPLTVVRSSPSDFNAEGKSDISLKNQTTGAVATWQMNGLVIAAGAEIANPGPPWNVMSNADFNGDQKSDIVLQNSNTGEVAVWILNGDLIATSAIVGSPGLSWVVKRTGDFNSDGKADIVLQNVSTGTVAVWQMNGAALMSGDIAGEPGPSWIVISTGDYNADGKADIVLRNSSTGTIAHWRMNGTLLAAGTIVGEPGINWTIRASGDFNGDGKSDLALQNTSTGTVATWLMNGPSIVLGSEIGRPPVAWVLRGSGDYNADEKDDLLLRDSTNGDVAEWQLSGSVIVASGIIASPGTGWMPTAE